MKSKGFTLIEILAVIVILGFLFLMLMPRMLDIVEDSRKDTFANSVQVMIASVSAYMGDIDREISLPSDGNGIAVTIDFLDSHDLIKKAANLDNSVVVVYNNAGTYEYYAFATDGNYYVDGYKSAVVKDHVQNVTTPIDYITETTGITDYTLTTGQLSY